MNVMANLLRGHVVAYHAIHEIQPEARVGYAWQHRPMRARTAWSPLDRLMRNIRYNGLNVAFPSAVASGVMKTPVGKFRVPEAKGAQDYFGLNYYTEETVWFNPRNSKELFMSAGFPEDADLSETGFIANIPEGFFKSIKWATKLFPHVPIIITENGVEDAADSMRPRYLVQHIQQMWKGVNFNWPVKGYFHWSLTDNFEWERGWTQRFGLWALDLETQTRTKRPSADLYAEICKQNALSSEMVEKYCPEVMDKLFPV
jgi:beta-glucosidase